MDLGLPIYCICDGRPVKAVPTDEGGMDVLVYNCRTGKFRREMGYVRRITFPEFDDETDVVSEEEFNRCVAELEAQRRHATRTPWKKLIFHLRYLLGSRGQPAW